MVNRGEGFIEAGSNAFVSAGDQVRLASAGDMVFADGCSVQVAAKEAFTVAAASPCFAGLTKAAFVQVQPAATGATTTAGGVSTTAAAGGASAGIGAAAIATPTVIAASIGALAVAGVVVAQDDDKPVSA